MSTFYLDPVNGDDANDGSTWALAWKTLTNGATAARIAPGDTIKIAKSPDEVNSGINATFNNLGNIVLASALTKEICDCESAWTASANVTDANDSLVGKMEGSYCRKLTIATAFTTGKIAYFALGASTDFSAYQKISLFMGVSADTAAGVFQICLCSDTTGDTPVDSFTVDKPISYDGLKGYARSYVTLNKGSALGSAIQSIAIYALSDPGAISVYLDNIIACNDFSLNSLVGKSGGPWWSIKAITDDTTIYLGTPIANDTYYAGTTESVGFYYRNPIQAPNIATEYSTACESINDSGTAGNLITFSGGWNTSSGLQDGMTIYDGINGMGYGIYSSNKTYIRLENIGYVRASRGFIVATTGSFWEWHNILATGCSVFGMALTEMTQSVSFTGSIMLAGNFQAFTFIVNSGNSSNSIYSTATIDCSGCGAGGTNVPVFNLTGGGHIFEGEVLLGTGGSTSQAAIFTNCFSTYFKKITVRGYGGFFIASERCADITIELLDMEYNISCSFYRSRDTHHCRIARVALNGHSFGVASPNINWGNHTGWDVDILGSSGRWYASRSNGEISDQITGGQNAAWAYGGEGTCLYLNPASTTRALPYIFYCPVTSNTTYQIHFQVKKTSAAANCTLEIDRISGCGMTEIKDESVTLTDSWAEHTSASFTPAYSGYVRCEVHALDGSTTGDIGIDDIHLHKVS